MGLATASAEGAFVELGTVSNFLNRYSTTYPRLINKIETLSNDLKKSFITTFRNNANALAAFNENPKLVNVILNYTAEGRDILRANFDIWLKHMQARELLRQGNYQEVVRLFGGQLDNSNTTVLFGKRFFRAADVRITDYNELISRMKAIMDRTDDIERIAQNLAATANVEINYARRIVSDVKQHYFYTEHFLQTEGGKFGKAFFEPNPQVLTYWERCLVTNPTRGDLEALQYILAHEYVEAKLLKAGMPYRTLAIIPDNQVFPYAYGAHDLAPLDWNRSAGLFLGWEAMKKNTTGLNMIFSDLDNLVNNIKKIEGL